MQTKRILSPRWSPCVMAVRSIWRTWVPVGSVYSHSANMFVREIIFSHCYMDDLSLSILSKAGRMSGSANWGAKSVWVLLAWKRQDHWGGSLCRNLDKLHIKSIMTSVTGSRKHVVKAYVHICPSGYSPSKYSTNQPREAANPNWTFLTQSIFVLH